MPPATTRHQIRADDVAAEFLTDTDKEQLGVNKEAIYDDLLDLEVAMFETVRKSSLMDTSMVGSSRDKDDGTPGTDAPSDAVAQMQSSP